MSIRVTKVRIYRGRQADPSSGAGMLLALVSVDVGELAIHRLKVVKMPDGRLIVSMPSILTDEGEWRDVVHPFQRKTRAELDAAVLGAYQREIAGQAVQGGA